MGITGFALVTLPSLLSPLDRTVQALSSVDLPLTLQLNLSASSQAIEAVADSYPNCITVAFLCVFDLNQTKTGLNQLADSLSNLQVDTGLGTVQTEIRQTAQGLAQVKTYAAVLVASFFFISVLFLTVGVVLLLLIREIGGNAAKVNAPLNHRD